MNKEEIIKMKISRVEKEIFVYLHTLPTILKVFLFVQIITIFIPVK